MKRITCSIVTALILFSLTLNVFAAPSYGQEINPTSKTYEIKFTDVPKTHWAFNYISEMVDRKVFSGYPDGLFRPDSIISRAEFAKIMINAAGLKVDSNVSTSGFIDADNHWSKAFVAAAKPYLTGYIDINKQKVYLPDENALREDIAVAMVRLKGYDTKLADLSIIEKMFTDYNTISEELKPYIAVAVEKGLMSGYPDGTFKPQDSITRAEAATLLWRAFQYGNVNKITDTTKETATPAPSTTPTPVPSATPSSTVVNYVYAIDTLVGNVKDIRSMVVDNRGIIYYIEGNTVKSSDGKQLSLKTDFKYNLGYDDKNFDFSLSPARLAYDKYNDKLYLLGNDKYDLLVVFALDGFQPKLIMNSKTNPKIKGIDDFGLIHDYSDTRSDAYIYSDARFFTNGSMIIDEMYVSGRGSSCLLINPNTGNIKLLPFMDYSIIIDDMVYISNLDYRDAPELKVYDMSFNLIKTVSIETKYKHLSLYSYFSRVFKPVDNKTLYTWQDGLYSLDIDGYEKLVFDKSIINLDKQPIPGGFALSVVNKEGSIIVYDVENQRIRIIKKVISNAAG